MKYIVTYKELRLEEIAEKGESNLVLIDDELKKKLCLVEPKFVHFLLHDRRRMYTYNYLTRPKYLEVFSFPIQVLHKTADDY